MGGMRACIYSKVQERENAKGHYEVQIEPTRATMGSYQELQPMTIPI